MFVKRLSLFAVCIGCLSFAPSRAEAGLFDCFKRNKSCVPAPQACAPSGGYYLQYPNGQMAYVPPAGGTYGGYASAGGGPPMVTPSGEAPKVDVNDLAKTVEAHDKAIEKLKKEKADK